MSMKLGTNQPMGPLTLSDFIGLDTCLSIMREERAGSGEGGCVCLTGGGRAAGVMHDGTGDPKYRPCPLLVQYVDAGWLGRKVGRGVFDYTGSHG